MTKVALHLEAADQHRQPVRLILQGLGGGRRLFDQRCILLRRLIHTINRLIYRVDTYGQLSENI